MTQGCVVPMEAAAIAESSEITGRIDAIIAARRRRLPTLQSAMLRWQETAAQMSHLDAALAQLREQPAVPDATRLALAERGDSRQLRLEIAEMLADMQALESRLARDTVNIGVSGQARVGKSTFLQSVSGLDDEQIPTGSGLPVTAVRSRIFHSHTEAGALMRRRSEESFLADLVGPFYRGLGLREPTTLDGFAADDRLTGLDVRPFPNGASLRDDLLKWQRSIPTYRADLLGDVRNVPLTELRGYVAYPDDGDLRRERQGAIIERKYLAVEDIRIRCRFPHADVGRIALVDLPGLGEIGIEVEAHHLDGLQHEVDLVLMVVRPAGDSAFWNDQSGRAMQLVKQVCGAAVDPRDFAFIVVNDDGKRPELIDALSGSILDKVNSGMPNRFHIVLTADAADPSSVSANVLGPVLRHAADNVGAMDSRLAGSLQDRSDQLASQVEAHAGALQAQLRTVPTASSAQLLDAQTDALRERLAAALGLVREHYQEQAGNIDEDYQEAVSHAYADATAWIADAFGRGEQEWRTEALAKMRKYRNSAPFAVDELNRLRVELSGRFRSLDDYFADTVGELLTRIEDTLADEFGALLAEGEGESARVGAGDPIDRRSAPGNRLRVLENRLNEAAEPCPHLAATVGELAGLTLDYRSHVYPWIAEQLRNLNFEVEGPGGERTAQFVVAIDERGAGNLLQRITEAAESAAYQTRSALLDGNIRPAAVLGAAAEYFEDAFIRSGYSEAEFRSLGRSYQNEIWPGVFSELSPQNAHLARVRALIKSISEKPKGVRL
ncbi:hypothetical protein EDD30_1061 [Couchioplanes caeruleus]|nr:hypothetical protein EDD30_1061 [Couchioplanes caeruleus]